MAVETRPRTPADAAWMAALLWARWGGTTIVSRGLAHDAAALPAIVALRDGAPAGLATYRIAVDDCELVSLDSTVEGAGVGMALIAAVREAATRAGCARVWLITTNDNTPALRFYQRRGFRLVAVHRDAVAIARVLKPSIPLSGIDGIPIRDEIELQLPLR